MRFFLLVLLYVFLAPVFSMAQKGDYQDAILVSFGTVVSGSQCSGGGSTQGESESDGTVHATTTTSAGCTDTLIRHYTVRVGDHTYIVRPRASKKSVGIGMATLGWSRAFEKQSVLMNMLPGSHILVRTDDDGFHVKVNKRESLYTVVQAQ